MSRARSTLVVALSLAIALPIGAQSVSNVQFVNGITVPAGLQDLSAGTAFDRRVGMFSDIYYDRGRNEWWGVSDRGPGGGTLPYETRVQRFTLSIDPNTGAISAFNVVQTIKFMNGTAMNGLAPQVASVLGNSLDPEGVVVIPGSGNLLVADEYGPTVAEFDLNGNLVRRFTVPENLIPKVGLGVDYNTLPPTLTSGREPNRGYEGIAISPDGNFAYAVLQDGTVADGWTGGTRGQYSRIVKYDMATGEAVGQYAYKLESTGQGRGISAIVALGNDKFLILERNNRGIGIGATLASPDKNVFAIDLNGATDVTGINLPTSGNLPAGFNPVVKGAKVMDLDANTLAELGNRSPEKWEGLAIGPQLNNGKYLILAGTDNDYSVTQNASGLQFDVWHNFGLADPYQSSIQCQLGGTTTCFSQNTLTPGVWDISTTWNDQYQLLPGVLHAYTADVAGYVSTVPEPESVVLTAFGLAALGLLARRRRQA